MQENSAPHNQPKIEDPNEYNQRRRLKEIADARAHARQAIDILQSGGNVENQTNITDVAYSAVQGLALELEWLVKEHGEDKYLQKELGPVTILPPGRENFEAQEDTQISRIIGGIDLEPKQVSVKGLYQTEDTGPGFVEIPQRLSETWTVNADTRHEGPRTLTARSTVQLPAEITIAAFRLCTEFIGENDLDARLEDKKPHGKV